MRIDSKDEVFEQTAVGHASWDPCFRGNQTLGCAVISEGQHEQWMAIFSEQMSNRVGIEHQSEPCESIVLLSDLPDKQKSALFGLVVE